MATSQWLVYPHTQYENKIVARKEGSKDKPSSSSAWAAAAAAAAQPDLPFYPKMRKKFLENGMKRSFRCVFLTHQDGHPAIVTVISKRRLNAASAQGVTSPQNSPYSALSPKSPGSSPRDLFEFEMDLFGGKAKAGESLPQALSRKLKNCVQPTGGSEFTYKIGDLLSVWWRPNFDSQLLPALPHHNARPKEKIEVYQVILPPKAMLLTKNKLEIVKLHELDTANPVVQSVPSLLSRFTINRMEEVEDYGGLSP